MISLLIRVGIEEKRFLFGQNAIGVHNRSEAKGRKRKIALQFLASLKISFNTNHNQFTYP
jgi:hypothetical protein